MTVSISASTSSFPPTMEAELTSDVDRAGDYLRAGGLVAFPTETVYGLGANAYLEKSVRRIFEVKGRPLTDPLIVHVAQIEEAWSVFACGGNTTYHHAASSNSVPHAEVRAAEEEKKEKDLLSTLAHAFWPGPLTLVAPAAAAIPSAVTAETGWVGVRVPSHSLARALLRAAAVPVVAPSANRFGHVSPTSAAHVQADLGGHSLLILKEKEEHRAGQGACEIGIESTVAKVDAREGRVTILRAGAVTCSQLESALRGKGVEVVVKGHARQQEEQPKAKAHGEAGGDVMPKELRTEDLTNDENKPQIAPGQCLKHYAPDRPTYLLSALQATESWVDLLASRAVILDMGGRLQRLKGLAAHYMDLSETGDVREAAAGLFQALRWAESVDGGKGKLELEEDLLVLIVDLGREGNRREGQGRTAEGEDAEFAVALIDRIMRSASGQAAGPFLVSP
ncbi:hypothetical protein NSK_001323 [Nannochloropsis salina CCMP1776]|uniref:Threonylcarbamoyl-AMP synthase n=1 Tax=Nannochloropsis salina CCMP1776 TaxID=1027361 RepID=A0A4D9DEB5_9STRA|nr:hypothetical protein NSK_001323 [Nannochloropsis salina CCMP1776]|eukprot:TFJ86989.1 hypothetical protein NSK_001323 [Nannochloropsis salina CCMP1776]